MAPDENIEGMLIPPNSMTIRSSRSGFQPPPRRRVLRVLTKLDANRNSLAGVSLGNIGTLCEIYLLLTTRHTEAPSEHIIFGLYITFCNGRHSFVRAGGFTILV